jgi:thiol:disulfide interchange protein
MIQADLTNNDPLVQKDLSRADRAIIPINLIYPADPSKPAILLEELISPEDALEALSRVE